VVVRPVSRGLRNDPAFWNLALSNLTKGGACLFRNAKIRVRHHALASEATPIQCVGLHLCLLDGQLTICFTQLVLALRAVDFESNLADPIGLSGNFYDRFRVAKHAAGHSLVNGCHQ
jgi:hypothetical protein